MDKDRIEKLISEYLAGKYSKEGEQLFNLWFDLGNDDLNVENISEEEVERLKAEILQSVRSNIREKEYSANISGKKESTGKQRHFAKVFKVAATVSVLVIAAVILFYQLPHNSKVSYTTGFGETLEVQLPDQSVVFLNANSNLSFEKDWQAASSREVWLEGEAFFEVLKKQISQNAYKKFAVYTDNVSVEVLGTQFNVNSRRTNTQVVLASGKVQLLTDNQEAIAMEPGDLVEVSGKAGQVVKKKVTDVGMYSSWRDGKIVFDEMTLSEIPAWLSDHYGVQVDLQGNFSDDKTFSAVFQQTELATLLKVIEESFQVNINQQGNTLIITEKRKKLPNP